MYEKLNKRIAESSPSSRFITLFLAIWDPLYNTLNYCNAGHNPPFILRSDGSIEKLTIGGMIIGILPDNSYEQETVTLNRNDILVLFTDGVTEAEIDDDEYGDDRLIECVKTSRAGDAKQILDSVRKSVTEFTGKQHYADDFTVMVLKKN